MTYNFSKITSTTKKILVLFILALLCQYSIKAQVLTVGSKWYYGIKQIAPSGSETLSTFEIVSDTVIQNDTFVIVKGNSNKAYYIQQQGTKIYYWLNNRKCLLFDTAINKGDTTSIDAFMLYGNKDTAVSVRIMLDSILYLKSNSLNQNDSLAIFIIKPIETILGASFDQGFVTEKVIHSTNFELSFLSIFNWPSTGSSRVNFRCFNSLKYNFKDTSMGTNTCDFIRVGMNDISKRNSIMVYPNPSKGLVFMNYTVSNNTNISVLLKDMFGKTIYVNNIDNFDNEETVSTILNFKESNISSGLYLLSVSNGNETFNYKLVLE